MEVEAEASGDGLQPAEDAVDIPKTNTDVVKQEENSLLKVTDAAAVDVKLTEERAGKESASNASDDSEKPTGEGAQIRVDGGVSDSDTGTNVGGKASHPRNTECASGDTSSPTCDLSETDVQPAKRCKQADRRPPVAGRCLPARDSRVAATLQNRFVVECERFGWIASPNGGGERKRTSAKTGSRPRSTQRVRSNVTRSPQQTDTAADATFKERKEQLTSSEPRKRGDSTSDEPSTVTKSATLCRPRRIARRGNNSQSSTKDQPKAREPPPTDSGRPRRHAADRAAAAILAAATASTGGFLVLDIPPTGSISTTQKKHTGRTSRRASSESETSQAATGEPAPKTEEKTAHETATGGVSEAEQRYEAISTDLDSKDDAKLAEAGENDGRRDPEAVASTDPDCVRTVGDHRSVVENEAVQDGADDPKGDSGYMEVAVELGSP